MPANFQIENVLGASGMLTQIQGRATGCFVSGTALLDSTMKNSSAASHSLNRTISRLAVSLCLVFVIARSHAAVLSVTNPADSGAGTLRATIAGASSGDTIIFDNSLSGQTILLTSGQIGLSNSVIIDGSALASPVQLSGNQHSRIFYVDGPVAAVLNSLVITNGLDNSGAGGGGILVYGTLTVNQGTFSGNGSPFGYGGAIFTYGSITLNNCSFLTNSCGSGGGAFWNGAQSTMNNCTFAGNAAAGSGGVVQNQAVLTVVNCTLLGNAAGVNGGAIYNLATVYLNNSIVCSNTAAGGGPSISGFGTTFQGLNLVDANAMLAPLGNYGGPTQTMPPLPGSPAIDGGNDSDSGGLATDQRGFPRIAGAHVDLGAVEGVTTPASQVTLTNTARLGDGSVRFSFTNHSDIPFSVLAGTNIASPMNLWTNLGSALETSAGSGQYQFTDPQAANYPQRFYRVMTP